MRIFSALLGLLCMSMCWTGGRTFLFSGRWHASPRVPCRMLQNGCVRSQGDAMWGSTMLRARIQDASTSGEKKTPRPKKSKSPVAPIVEASISHPNDEEHLALTAAVDGGLPADHVDMHDLSLDSLTDPLDDIDDSVILDELARSGVEAPPDGILHEASMRAASAPKKRGRLPVPPVIPSAAEFHDLLRSVTTKGLLDKTSISAVEDDIVPAGYNVSSLSSSSAALDSLNVTIGELLDTIDSDLTTAVREQALAVTVPDDIDVPWAPEDLASLPVVYQGGDPVPARPGQSSWEEELRLQGEDPNPIRVWVTAVVTYNRTHRAAVECAETIFEFLKNGTGHDPRIHYELLCVVRSDTAREGPLMRALDRVEGTTNQTLVLDDDVDDAFDQNDVRSVEELQDMIQMWAEGYNTHHLIDGLAMRKTWGGLAPEVLLSERNLAALLHQVKVALEEDESGGVLLSPRMRNIRLKGGTTKLTNGFNTQAPDDEFSVISR